LEIQVSLYVSYLKLVADHFLSYVTIIRECTRFVKHYFNTQVIDF
jgi:hypothetical protein